MQVVVKYNILSLHLPKLLKAKVVCICKGKIFNKVEMDLCRPSPFDQIIHFPHCGKPRQPLKVAKEVTLRRQNLIDWKTRISFEHLFSFKQFSIGNISKWLAPEASNIHPTDLLATDQYNLFR